MTALQSEADLRQRSVPIADRSPWRFVTVVFLLGRFCRSFIHPPGRVALFWLLHRLFGEAGFGIAQLFSYAVFFWAMPWLATEVLRPLAYVSALIVSGLSAFSPIMTHVVSRYWLDGRCLLSPRFRRRSISTARSAAGRGLTSVAWCSGTRR